MVKEMSMSKEREESEEIEEFDSEDDIVQPVVDYFVLNGSVDPTTITLKVSLTGAENAIVIHGSKFDTTGHLTFVVTSPGLSFFDFNILSSDATTLTGTFKTSGITFPGLQYNLVVLVINAYAQVHNAATIDVVL
jgi:hypothetical protein